MQVLKVIIGQDGPYGGDWREGDGTRGFRRHGRGRAGNERTADLASHDNFVMHVFRHCAPVLTRSPSRGNGE
jgi:hypothetical protein